ncbi:G patch domain-containing protein 4-like [Arctopsyche grandis]|uniref:G patch domain-containing protein 4-like n=1 Tax=Arctopsyche grandis TaxID=121162 RepID=UPI00406D8293
MDFAKKQLEKYGWTKGKGLGKNENGISQALKPKPKRSSGGLGHNMADEFTNHWWNKVYNNATTNIEVNTKQNGEVESFTTNSKKNNRCKNGKIKSDNMPLYFQTFVQTATLTNGEMVQNESEKSHVIEKKDDEPDNKAKVLTDEELFAACGKRTAHKGARHGLKSNGKLARINMQEQAFLSQQKLTKETNNHTNNDKSSDTDSSTCKSNKHKRKKTKQDETTAPSKKNKIHNS